ncbi:hypothetical protein GOV12_03065 [Candidatus Pacearchaeota archaeon]|nr:hypothetical protein [Candidatus Pacearchaeota archaeon]
MIKRGNLVDDRKGIELVFSTWVIIVLSVLVLVLLVLFFSNSTGSFFDNIKNYFSKTNVDSVVRGCNILIDSGFSYEFCCESKTVKYIDGGEKRESELTCFEFSGLGLSKDIKDNDFDCSGECFDSSRITQASCEDNGGRWNECGSKCGIDNQGKGDVACLTVCDEICECGEYVGLSCPPGFDCMIPEEILDGMGYCEK